MSDKESAQQKKKPGPTKLQLSWSASAAAPSRVSLSQGKSSRKRKRSTSSAKKPKKDESNSMWVDKYAPTNSADLCVAPKKVKEVKQWIEAAANASTSSNVARMLIWVGSPGVGKSTSIRILAKELGCTLHEWSDTYSTQYFENSSYYLQSVDQTNALGSFEEFLQRAGAGYTPLDGSSQPCKSVILIDELPNLHTLEAEERFREIMTRHLQSSNVPTVFIYSNVQEGKHRPADLERLIDPTMLYSPSVLILQCHAVTKARMKRTLENICKKESIRLPPTDFWDEVHLQSAGDLRHAIMALQFRGSADKNSSKKSVARHYERDTKLSTFHALGKILYAKRRKDVIVGEGKRPPLDFHPESVMERSDMGLDGSLTFLEYHAPDFFTDVDELNDAYELYSDAAMLLDQSLKKDHGDSTIYPGGYAASLAGRAVAHANKHPAPNTFRQFSAPKVFDVLRKRRQNELTFRHLCQRLSVGSEHLLVDANLGSSRMFVRDSLPYLRKILPHDVEASLNTLFSYVHPSERAGRNSSDPPTEETARLAEEQRQILAMDDIVDDSDDDSWDAPPPSAKRPARERAPQQDRPIHLKKKAAPQFSPAQEPVLSSQDSPATNVILLDV